MRFARYLAVAGDASAIDAQIPSSRLIEIAGQLDMRVALDRPGLKLVADPDLPCVPVGKAGMLIGTLFAPDGCPIFRLDDAAVQSVLSDKGRHLVTAYWGSYAAFLETRGSGYAVVRDPSGGVGVYWTSQNGLDWYFGALEPAITLGLIPGEIDSGFLAQWLAYPRLRCVRTGLAQVYELFPGTRRTGADGETDTLWRPSDHVAPIYDFEEAKVRLRETLLPIVEACASRHDRLLLELSGGLDSSLLAAALAHKNVSFSAVNFTTGLRDGDERAYAGAIAQMHEIDLVETGVDPADEFLVPSQVRRVRPGASLLLGPIDRAIARTAARIGATTLISGGGGDNVFCFLGTAAPIVDAWRLRGLGEAWRALRDTAELCGCTIWIAARQAARRARGQAARPAWRADTRFLASGNLPPPEPHPWLDVASAALPGKREHIEALVVIQDFLDAADRVWQFDMDYPLLAQPLVELCLHIPSWLWIRGGRDRSVARAAFADLLPYKIVNRRTKGSIESLCARAYARNRKRLAELLLEGRLQRWGIADREEMEAYLSTETINDHRYIRMFDLVTLELWISSWLDS